MNKIYFKGLMFAYFSNECHNLWSKPFWKALNSNINSFCVNQRNTMSHNDNYWRIDVRIGREPSGESPLSITHKKRLQKQS